MNARLDWPQLDLAPHSDEYCSARGIKPACEDFAANEMVELPAPEHIRNVLVAAIGGVRR